MSEVWDRFKADAARWIYPEKIGDPNELGPKEIAVLLRRHRELRAIAWFRLGGWGRDRGIRGSSWYVDQRLQRVFGLDVPVNTDIGGGFYIAHTVGVTINAEKIGRNVTMVGALTIGLNGEGNAPVIGDEVYIGAGARVLGDIHIGDRVKVGANSVVLHDVPADLTVVGAPAKPTARSIEAAAPSNELSA